MSKPQQVATATSRIRERLRFTIIADSASGNGSNTCYDYTHFTDCSLNSGALRHPG